MVQTELPKDSFGKIQERLNEFPRALKLQVAISTLLLGSSFLASNVLKNSDVYQTSKVLGATNTQESESQQIILVPRPGSMASSPDQVDQWVEARLISIAGDENDPNAMVLFQYIDATNLYGQNMADEIDQLPQFFIKSGNK